MPLVSNGIFYFRRSGGFRRESVEVIAQIDSITTLGSRLNPQK